MFHIGIVAHVDRMGYVDALREQISPEIVSPDDGTLGAGGNHIVVLHALQQADPARWAVVLEDDCVPVDGFLEQLGMALAVAPTRIVSLYAGTGYPAQYQQRFIEAANTTACWLLHEQLRHAVGYAIHPDILADVIHVADYKVCNRYAPEDAISWWAAQHGMPISYTNPSLVDHVDGPTVIDYRMHLGHAATAGRKRARKAYRTGTRPAWDSSTVAAWGGRWAHEQYATARPR